MSNPAYPNRQGKEFARRCAEGRHLMTGGTERLGGFSLVETDAPVALAEFVNELLADTTGPTEIRATIRPREGS